MNKRKFVIFICCAQFLIPFVYWAACETAVDAELHFGIMMLPAFVLGLGLGSYLGMLVTGLVFLPALFKADNEMQNL